MKLPKNSLLAGATAVSLLLSACGGADSPSPATADRTAAQTKDTASPAADGADTASPAADGADAASPAADGADTDRSATGDAKATLALTVSGGEFAGSYSGSVADGGCSRNLSGDNTFGVQYSTDQPVKVSSVQVLVFDAKAAAGGSDAFKSEFTFGDLFSGTSVDVDPSTNAGSGTVTIDDRGDSATVKISGETGDGDGIEATIECNGVLDIGS